MPQLEMHVLYTRHDDLYFAVVNRVTATSKTSVGF